MLKKRLGPLHGGENVLLLLLLLDGLEDSKCKTKTKFNFLRTGKNVVEPNCEPDPFLFLCGEPSDALEVKQ